MAGLTGILRPLKGANYNGIVALGGTINLGAGGAVSSYSFPGVTVAKTGGGKVGRYTLTLSRKSVAFAGGLVTLIGPDDAAITGTAGSQFVFRDNDIASDGTIELQAIRSDTSADAEIDDNLVLKVVLLIIDSGAP